MTKLYVAGPMTGYPDMNFPEFRWATETLRDNGHEVFSPHEANEAEGYDSTGQTEDNPEDRRRLLAVDLEWICLHAEGLAMLDGWEDSSGARAEHATALALGIEVHQWWWWVPVYG